MRPGALPQRLWRFDLNTSPQDRPSICYNFDDEDETKAANINFGISVLSTHDFRPVTRIQRALEESEHRARN